MNRKRFFIAAVCAALAFPSIALAQIAQDAVTGGAGGVSTTGSPTAGSLAQFSGPSTITNGNLSGDCPTNNTLAVMCQAFVSVAPYTASYWYMVPPAQSLGTGSTYVASQIYCRLIQFPRIVTFTNIGLNVLTGVGGGNIQVAFYTSSSGLPATLIQSTASISTATNGNKSGALGGAVQFGPGGSSAGREVYGCVNSDNTTHTTVGYSTGFNYASVAMGGPTQASISVAGNSLGLDNIQCNGAACNGGSSTFGTWPSSLAGTTWTYSAQTTRFPALQMQVTSSP